MKRLLLILGLCFALTACGQTEQATTDQTAADQAEQQTAEETDTLVCGDCTAKLLGVDVYKDGEGNDAAVVSVEYTNNSSEPMTFDETFYIKLYQDGVEQHASESFLGEGYDWDAFYTSIKDGATITIYQQKPLTKTTGPVEVELQGFDSNSGLSLGSITKTFEL